MSVEIICHVARPSQPSSVQIKRILYQIVDEKGKRCLAIAKVDLADYIESLQLPSDLLSIVRVPYE